MTAPWPIPAQLFWEPEQAADAFLSSVRPSDCAYFLLNVGDGDSQVLVLPEHHGRRTVLIVDCRRAEKTRRLIEALQPSSAGDRALLAPLGDTRLRFVVVGTHPHADHIAGIPALLRRWHANVAEYWDSGYRHTGQDYERLANELEQLAEVSAFDFTQPTSGTTRYFGRTRITVLGPSIRLRNYFDTFGVLVNDASLVLKVEFPLQRLPLIDRERRVREREDPRVKFLLGGDAQALAWGSAMSDFPQLQPHSPDVYAALRDTGGTVEPLACHVFKVPHHASKRGVNLELVERCAPKLTLVSSRPDGSNYHFPHAVAQETIREALQATTGGGTRTRDWALGCLYTGDEIAAGDLAENVDQARSAEDRLAEDSDGDRPATRGPAGSLALVTSNSRAIRVWRFRDAADENVRLDRAVRYLASYTSTAGVP